MRWTSLLKIVTIAACTAALAQSALAIGGRRIRARNSARGRAAARPLSLHPANPHYLLFRGRPVVLITSGEHYGAVLNADFDFSTYLRELQRDGLNLTRTWSGSYRELPGSFGITENTLAPLPGRCLCPWARSGTPGNFDGGNRFDLGQWDPAYFKRLHRFMADASRRGVVVEMNLFCPNYEDALWKANPLYAGNNINGVGDCPGTEVYTLKHPDLLRIQEAMVRKIVTELAGCDNPYYEICNEPYFGGVTSEWQLHIAQVIVDTERDLPTRHLISQNIANGKAQIVSPDPAVSIFNFHYATPPAAIAMNYALNRVIGENETGFRGKDDALYRSEAWEFILAGGGLYNNLDYSFTASHPAGDFTDYRSPGGGSPALRRQLKTLQQFISAFNFIRMKPDLSTIVGDLPRGTRAQVLTEPGRQVAVYLFGSGVEQLRLALPQGSYRVQWTDTLSGSRLGSTTMRHQGGVADLTVPAYREDIALSIRLNR